MAASGTVATLLPGAYYFTREHKAPPIAALRAAGVPTAVYYPVPMHIQSAYSHYPRGAGGLPVTEAKASQVISLPMHPYMTPQTQDRIVAAIAGFNG